MRMLLILILLLLPLPVQAGFLPEDKQAEVVQLVLKHFWGNAKLPDGSVIQPRDEQDRLRVPVAPGALQVVFDAGEVSGIAQWCGLDWQPNFAALMAWARSTNNDERQAAYIATLHGFVSGYIHNAMKTRACDDALRSKAQAMLQNSITQLQK